MLRRIDQFVGRHMSAKRWIVIWLWVVLVCSTSLWIVRSWAVWTFCPVGIVLGSIMAWGNLRRLR